MDESISVFERSVPVDFKQVSLALELPKEIKIQPDETVNVTTETDAAAIDVQEGTTGRTSGNIMTDIINTIKIIGNKQNIKASESNWYKHASKVNVLLMDVPYSLTSDEIIKYVIYHYLDVLPLDDKLELVSYIYSEDASIKGHWKTIKEYYDKLLLTVEDETAIVLANGEENKMFVREEGRWKPSQYTDERTFAPVRSERLMVDSSKINRTEIGFMHPFKQKEVVFKTKDLTQKRNNKGAKCTDSAKPMVASKIATILNHKSIVYMETPLERPQLCVLLEILLRWLTDTQSNVYFFGPEKTNEMDITNLKL
jgi:hypothetical protein